MSSVSRASTLATVSRARAPKAPSHRRPMSLPRLGLSAGRRSISAAGAAASSMASNVSAAASSVVSTASQVVSSVSASMASASQELASFARVRRRPQRMSLAALDEIAMGDEPRESNATEPLSNILRKHSPSASSSMPLNLPKTITLNRNSETSLINIPKKRNTPKPIEQAPKPMEQAHLPALEGKPSEQLPRLSLEGSEASRPPMCLHNVGLIRWINEEARDRHMARASYQARLHDSTTVENLNCVIFREVCNDLQTSTRDCCRAYRAIKHMKLAAKQRMDPLSCNLRRVRRKMLVGRLLCKILGDVREENAKAEIMWKQCCAGLGSCSLASKAFVASRSLGVASFTTSSLALPLTHICGNISVALRSRRNGGGRGHATLDDSTEVVTEA